MRKNVRDRYTHRDHTHQVIYGIRRSRGQVDDERATTTPPFASTPGNRSIDTVIIELESRYSSKLAKRTPMRINANDADTDLVDLDGGMRKHVPTAQCYYRQKNIRPFSFYFHRAIGGNDGCGGIGGGICIGGV